MPRPASIIIPIAIVACVIALVELPSPIGATVAVAVIALAGLLVIRPAPRPHRAVPRTAPLRAALGDLSKVGSNVPWLRDLLADLRYRHDRDLVSIARANGADPDAGMAGHLRRTFLDACAGIDDDLAEAERLAAIVRRHIDLHPDAIDEPAPLLIATTWRDAIAIYQHAHGELFALRRLTAS